VAAWADGNTGNADVRARLFHADGSTASDEFLVNATSSGHPHSPTITALSGGRFMVAWQDWDGATGDDDVWARLFDADGSTSSDAFLMTSSTAGYRDVPTTTALDEGRFVVAWTDGTSGRYDVRARLFNADGSTTGRHFRINSTSTGYPHVPTITALSDGRFVVVWSDGTSGRHDVRARLFHADGSTASGEFLVSPTSTGHPDSPTITALSGGRFIVAWQHWDGATGTYDLRARTFAAPPIRSPRRPSAHGGTDDVRGSSTHRHLSRAFLACGSKAGEEATPGHRGPESFGVCRRQWAHRQGTCPHHRRPGGHRSPHR
jgi:hypothetical protein